MRRQPAGIAEALSRIKDFAKLRRKRLLVVEDNKAEQLSIGELLGYDDIEIVNAGTGTEALSTLREQPCDCVVLDLRLPDMTGFEVLEQMRADAALADVPRGHRQGIVAEEDAQIHTGHVALSSRGWSRRSACWTRRPCSCIASLPTCRPINNACSIGSTAPTRI